MSEQIELGCAGHLIVAKDCRFRRHTQIIGEARSFRVSTVGDLYYPDDPKRQTVGSGESYAAIADDDPPGNRRA